jgi:hypothetical protein
MEVRVDWRRALFGDTRDGVQRLSNLLSCGVLGVVLTLALGFLIMWASQ